MPRNDDFSLILAKAKLNGMFPDVKNEELDAIQQYANTLFTDDGALKAAYSPSKPFSAVFFGDSQTAQALGGGSGDPLQWNCRGYYIWMNAFLGQAFTILNHAGVSGDTISQMQARVQKDVIAYNPGWVFLWAGKNDISLGFSYSEVIARYTLLLDTLQVNGNPKIVVITDPPNNFDALGSPHSAIRDQFNNWLRQLPRNRAQVVACVDAYSALVDPTTNQYGAGMNYDNIHPSANGAYRIGVIAADTIRHLVPKGNLLSSGNDTTNLLGASGSFNGAGLATGWQEYHDVSVSTFTTEARTDGIAGNWQKVVTGATGGQFVYADTATGFSVGDTLYAIAEISIETAWGQAVSTIYPNFDFELQPKISGSNNGPAAISMQVYEGLTATPAGVMTVRTPNIVVPAGTTSMSFFISLQSHNTTFRIGRAAIRKA